MPRYNWRQHRNQSGRAPAIEPGNRNNIRYSADGTWTQEQ
jgi:hypothetical protein